MDSKLKLDNKNSEKVKIMLKQENDLSKKSLPIKKSSFKKWVWPLKIFILTLSLGLFFSVLSEIVLSKSGIVVAIVVIAILLVAAVVFDIIGVAAAACRMDAFNAMADMKVKFAREAIILVRNSDKVSSFSCDIIGDICSILSGSAGAAIVTKLALPSGATASVLMGTLVCSFIASLTVFGKAIGKSYAINNSASVIYKVAKTLSIFTSRKTTKKNEKSTDGI